MRPPLLRAGLLLIVVLLLAVLGGAGAVGLPGLSDTDLTQAVARAQQLRGAEVALNIDAIARRTAELRGLPLLSEVQRTVLTPDQFRARLIDDFNKPENLEAIENSRRLMIALGLIGQDVDLYALELEFRTGVVLGQYDPETKQLYLISGEDTPGQLERVTLAHEFTHALQDQHYDIRRLIPEKSDNSDRDLAVSALLEGDALILEDLYQEHAMTRAERDEKRRQERALSSNVRFDRLPLVIVEETYFPYVEGPRFIISVVGREPMRQVLQTGSGYGALVAPLFERPPTSTAQIIHPEKYINRVDPIPVQFPDLATALGEGWRELRKDLLGELDHRIIIQQFMNRDLADRAAAGWAGDAFALLGNGDESVVVVRSHWDTAGDATEWFDAYAQAMRARYGSQLVVVDQRADRVLWRTPDGMQALSRSGTTTHLVIARTLDQVTSLERALGAVTLPGVPRLVLIAGE
jgi:hypothetical protein